jgi:hypothetical protein
MFKTEGKRESWIKLLSSLCVLKMFYIKKRRRSAITPADIPPVTGTVTIHATIIFRNKDQSTLCFERKRPIATTLPTLQWVVLIGIDKFDATRTVNAVDTSITKPLKTIDCHI